MSKGETSSESGGRGDAVMILVVFLALAFAAMFISLAAFLLVVLDILILHTYYPQIRKALFDV